MAKSEPCPTCSEPCPTCRGRGFLPPLKECASETCSNWFRWQEGGAKKGQYRTTGVLYCSTRCARAQGQRELRRRRKQASYTGNGEG